MNRRTLLCSILAACLFSAAAPAVRAAENPVVVFETSKGNFEIELFADKAPLTVKNFLAYVEAKHFDGTIFHRVKSDFMIQGGGFDADYKEKPTGRPIKNEADNGLRNEAGTVAMARTGDPHSASAQFFINTVNNAFLNHSDKTADGWGYCVFGKIKSGMDTVIEIKNVPIHEMKDGFQWLPKEPVVIKTARLKK